MNTENMLDDTDPDIKHYNAGPARNLLPESIRSEMPAIAEFLAADSDNPKLYVRLFAPTGRSMEWYVAAATDRTTGTASDDTALWVLVVPDYDWSAAEWGTASLRKLKSLHVGCYLGIERDLYFSPTSYRDLRGNR